MIVIELSDDSLGFLENGRVFNRRLFDWDFAVCTTTMKSELDFFKVVIPIESIFHFIAILPFFSVSLSWGNFYIVGVNVFLS